MMPHDDLEGGGSAPRTASHQQNNPHPHGWAVGVDSNGNGQGVPNTTEGLFAEMRARVGYGPKPPKEEPTQERRSVMTRVPITDDRAARRPTVEEFLAKIDAEPSQDLGDDAGPGEDQPEPEPITPDESPPRLEDAHIGAWVAKTHLQNFLYAGGLGWLRYDGCRWTPVEEIIVSEAIRKAVIKLWETEALIELSLNEEARRAQIERLKRISGLLSARRIRAILYIAKGCRATKEVFGAGRNSTPTRICSTCPTVWSIFAPASWVPRPGSAVHQDDQGATTGRAPPTGTGRRH